MDFTPRVRSQRIANLTATMTLIHNTRAFVVNREGYDKLSSAWKYIFRQRELYLTHALCEHCGKVIDNRDYDGWKHEDGDLLCDIETESLMSPEAVPAIEVRYRRAA